MHHPVIRRAIALLFASALVLAACGDDDTAATTQTTTSSTTSTATSTTTADSSTTTAASSDLGTVVDITVAGGDVTGGGRKKISLGDTVTLRVTSDVADEIHLHGYDVMVDVGAGQTAELTFDATIPGVFEAELENEGITLVELEIS